MAPQPLQRTLVRATLPSASEAKVPYGCVLTQDNVMHITLCRVSRAAARPDQPFNAQTPKVQMDPMQHPA